MKNTETIPEFIGILILMGLVMTVVGVTIGYIYEGIKNYFKNEEKVNFKEIQPEKTLIRTNNLNTDWSESDKTKFKICSIFYGFCFSKETAKIFLIDNPMTENISRGLKLSRVQLQKINILESIFKIYAKKNHRIELGESSYNFYTINKYKFFIDTQRISVREDISYFEILYNDFKDVKDENGNKMAIAKEFILYIRGFEPKAIFVLVYDPILEVYALRRVSEDGVSFKIAFINDNESSESIDFLADYVLKNNL